MTSETSYREKGRAAFLAAIMVLSVVAMSGAFAVSAAANTDVGHDIGDDGPTWEEGDDAESIWVGQVVTIGDEDENEAGYIDASGVEIHEGLAPSSGDSDDRVTTVQVNNGQAEIDSSDLEDGEPYHLVTSETEWDGVEFWVESEELETEFDQSTVQQDGEVDLEVSTERDYQHLNVTSDDLDGDELKSIFEGYGGFDDAQVDDDTLSLIDVYDGDFAANFTDIDAGEYEFEFESTDSLASDNASIQVTDDDADVSFVESPEGEVGDVVNVTVALDHIDTGVIQLGNADEDGFQSAVEFEDDSDDGLDEITLQFNTYTISEFDEGETDGEGFGWTVHEDYEDDVEITTSAVNMSVDAPLEPHAYELTAGTEGNFDDDDNTAEVDSDAETDTAYFVLDDKSALGDVTTQIAPEDADLGGDYEDFEDATVTESNVVAEGDYLLLTAENFGTEGAVVDNLENGGDANDFLDAVSVNLTAENQDTPPNAPDSEVDLTVDWAYTDEYTGDLVLIIEYEDNADGDIDIDDTYDLTFEVTEENEFIDDEDDEIEVETEFTVEEGDLELDDANEEIGNSANAEITGETNAAPGSEVDTSARSAGNFTMSSTAIVDSDGTFAAEYDFSEYDAGIEFDIDAENDDVDGEDDMEAVLVDADEPIFNLDADAPGEVEVGEDADLDVTVSNDGGSAGDVDVIVTIDGEEMKNDTTSIDADDSWSDSFAFDTDAEGDIEWEVTAGDDTDSGTLSVVDEIDDGDADDGDADDGDADDGDADDGDADDGDADDGDADDDDDDGDADDDGTPGFGIAVALAALLGAAMLALRRQD